jgi:hypothetical protein
MNDLIVVPQQNQWLRLKSLVLDSVSSPDHETRLQFGAGRVLCLVRAGAPRRLHQGYRERLAGCPGSPRTGFGLDQRADHRRAQTRCGGIRQRAAGSRTGQRDHTREGRRVQRRAARKLAFRPAGTEAAKRS